MGCSEADALQLTQSLWKEQRGRKPVGSPKRLNPAKQSTGGVEVVMEHETRFAGQQAPLARQALAAELRSAGREFIGSTASATASSPAAPPTNYSLIARSSPSRWQVEHGIPYLADFERESVILG
jgi:hypothetical protein